MEKRTSTWRKTLVLSFTLLCAAVFLLGPIQTQAASKRTRKQGAKTVDRNFLYESDYRSFTLIDVNRDGLKELVVSY